MAEQHKRDNRRRSLRIVLQRVTSARVEVDNEIVGEIERGLLILIGVAHGDSDAEARWLANKTAELRVFTDEAGKMNRSLIEMGGSALVVSQFTLLADCRRGRRPAFTDAGPPELAESLYRRFGAYLAERGIDVQYGVFAADMKVNLTNDGPVTIVIDRVPESV